MSKLLALRQKLNLTQEDLFEKTGISVRTIQRIEAGNSPKGYTLKALAKGLEVSEEELIEKERAIAPEDTKWLKLINLSVLLFIFFPPLNIAAPLIIMYLKKQFTSVTRKLVTIQIVWTLIAIVLFLTVITLNDWFAIRSKYMMLIPVVWLLINVFIILLNAAEIDKRQTLRISINFSLI